MIFTIGAILIILALVVAAIDSLMGDVMPEWIAAVFVALPMVSGVIMVLMSLLMLAWVYLP